MGHNTGVCEIKSFGPFLLFLLVLQEEREIIFSCRARRRGENGGIFIIFIFSFFFRSFTCDCDRKRVTSQSREFCNSVGDFFLNSIERVRCVWNAG